MNIKNLILVAAVATSTLASLADDGTHVLESASVLQAPSIEAGAFYRSMKIERGMVENDESVFGYEVALEWYGLFGGVEACYDMTDVNGRKGRYNEIESFAGYGYTFGDLTARAAYVYKACAGDEPDTQEIEVELEYETPWVTPFAELACDVKDKPGALYGSTGLHREWELCECLCLVTCGGIGFGNAYRNDGDFGRDSLAFRDIHAGAELEMALCPHMKLVPSVDIYDSFTSAQRHAYDRHNGFACAAGCRLVAEF